MIPFCLFSVAHEHLQAFTMVFGLCASQAPGDEFPMGHPGTPPRMPGRYDADRCLDPTTLAGRCRIPWMGNGVPWKVCKVSSCLIILCAFGHTCSHVPTISHCFGWKPNAQVETSIFEGANFAFQNRGLRKVQVDARSCRYLHQA